MRSKPQAKSLSVDFTFQAKSFNNLSDMSPGCIEGSAHSLWINPKNGVVEAVPRHNEIKEPLARKILMQNERQISIPHILYGRTGQVFFGAVDKTGNKINGD